MITLFWPSMTLLLTLALCNTTIDIKLSNNQNYSVLTNSSLNQEFNISTISPCACSYNELFYALPLTSISNFTIIPSDFSKELKDIKLFSNNNAHPSYYSLEKSPEEGSFKLQINTPCTKKESGSSSFKPPSSYYHPEAIGSYETWSAIRFQFSYDNTNYYFEYIKFCQLDSLLFSICSSVLIFLLATLMLFLSTYMQIDLQIVKEISEITEVEWYHSVIFVIIISCVLLLIFFFMKYMVMIYTFLFFFQSIMCLYYALKYFSKNIFAKLKPDLNEKKYFSFKLTDFSSFTLSFGLVIVYYITRHWVLNNVLAFGMVFAALSLILFKNFKVCFWFLLCIFLYDTFWVFFSEKVFNGSNVMVKAATSIRLPMKLEMPIIFSTNPIKDCMMLGMGDIALPGLIVKYCKRFDSLSKGNKNYFWVSMLLYVVSVALALAMMFAFEHSQPVLFYISPIFIIGLMLKAFLHNELRKFWNGLEKESEEGGRSSQENHEANRHRSNSEIMNQETEMEFRKVKTDDN